jgi:hypothetical protein
VSARTIQSDAMVLVTLQARLTTPRLASLCVRAGLEANYVSHHHRTLDLIRIQERSSVTETLLLALNLQGMQNDCDMIPLMMQSNFKPKGWLGLILGTRLWCKSFHGLSSCD